MILEPGFYPDMDEATYFADPCPTPSLRQSGIKELLGKSPHHLAFKHPRLNPYGAARTSTRFMRVGQAVHSLALGRGKEVSVVRYPDWRNSSAKRAADAAIAAGRIPVLEREYERAAAGAAVLRDAIEVELGGAEYFTEVPLFWTEETPFGPIWCAAMLDVWAPSIGKALDCKFSSVVPLADSVGRDMAANGYDVQRSWYRRGLSALAPHVGRFDFATLYCENEPPHGFSSIELDEASDYVALGDCNTAVRVFARCLHSRTWPSYPRRQVVGTPPYHHQAATARQLSEDL